MILSFSPWRCFCAVRISWTRFDSFWGDASGVVAAGLMSFFFDLVRTVSRAAIVNFFLVFLFRSVDVFLSEETGGRAELRRYATSMN